MEAMKQEVEQKNESPEIDELNLTPEEEAGSALQAGIRGQIKKVMRAFVAQQTNAFTRMTNSNDSFQKHVVTQMNDSLAKIDKKFSGMYSMLLRQFLVKQESRVANAEVAVRSLIDLSADEIYSLLGRVNKAEVLVSDLLKSSEPIPAFEVSPLEKREDFIGRFRASLAARMDAIAVQLRDDAEKAAMTQQEEVKKKAEVLDETPAPAATTEEVKEPKVSDDPELWKAETKNVN